MLDPHFLRNHPQKVHELCRNRGLDFDIAAYSKLEKRRHKLQEQVQTLQHQRNQGAQAIAAKVNQQQQIADERTKMQQLNEQLKQAKAELDELLVQLNHIQLNIPNLLDESVPIGKDERDNKEILTWGDKPNFSFQPKQHYELFPQQLDLELAAQMAGSRFTLLKGDLALLHRALTQLMLDVHTRQHHYEEVYVPVIVREQALVHSGQLPKFDEDLFHLQRKDSYLIPTAEVPLVNIAAKRIFNEDELPLKFTAYSCCFRSEAGSYGKDVKGMLRLHQFDKVELVQITKPDQSMQALEDMCLHAQKILQLLELPYRVVSLCSGDIGFAATKTYDIEVWLPGQNSYREISSCSNCADFQARRMQARWRDEQGNRQLVHSLNASGLAVGRTLIAVLENYQTAEGKVSIPKALLDYLPKGIRQLG